MPPQTDHAELKRLLETNNRLIEENTKVVRRLYRWTVANMVWKLLWLVLLIGLPFALYFYVLEPYFAAFGSNYETFLVGINEIPGLKGLDQLIRETFQTN
jgi:hypothetical protein